MSPHREAAALTIQGAWPFQAAPHRAVFKFGSNLLSAPDGRLDGARIRSLAEGLARWREAGTEVFIVTSGAVAAGMGIRGSADRPKELPDLQALAAIGQCHVMDEYIAAFGKHGLTVAQVLLTRGDLEDRRRYLNAKSTLEALVGMGAIPVINENDTVVTEELTFGDNDMLSAIMAAKLGADLLVILTDIDGLFTSPPAQDAAARLIEVVPKVTTEIERLGGGSGSRLGRGGMATKVLAARHATRFGITTVIGNGRREGLLDEIRRGDFRGTLFLARQSGRRRGQARAHWIALRTPKGAVTVDDGARRALLEGGRSLLPVGIVSVSGDFTRGDVISIRDRAGEDLARGITNYSSGAVARLKGHKGNELAGILGGEALYEEVIHRNNLHLRH
ncbi:glutamate 5-kinase [Candidatus Poribacteria bacterium]|nr:glutamate 5-kinase [Candidatus Poribacteria bacterium]